MRILFVTSNRVGDAVLSTGLLDHLIRTYPRSRITVVCGPVATGIFERMPNRERTIVLDKRPYGRHWLPLWADAVRTVWDLVVDIRGSALSFLVPTRRRAIWRRRPGPKIAELGAILRLDEPPVPVAWTGPVDEARAATLIPSARPVIALGPTANWLPKVWPAARYADLFASLASGPLQGAVPAIFAGPGPEERDMATPLLDLLPEAVDLCGALTLPEVAACFKRCALFVGNDSGLMHLAAATGIPTLGLFGPTPWAEYAPSGHCAGFVRSPTERMEDLTVAKAVAEARSLLSRAANGHSEAEPARSSPPDAAPTRSRPA